LVKAGKFRLVLNLSHLRKLDTTGLGTLLFALSELRNAGGNLAILNLKTSGLEALTDAHLEAVFQVFRDEQDALNSFFPDRATNHYDVLEFVKSNSNSSSDH